MFIPSPELSVDTSTIALVSAAYAITILYTDVPGQELYFFYLFFFFSFFPFFFVSLMICLLKRLPTGARSRLHMILNVWSINQRRNPQMLSSCGPTS